ncbi:unnamed protein product, partial [Polarella glacialis]
VYPTQEVDTLGENTSGEDREDKGKDPREERGLMVALVAAAYVVWTMDKVNMSIAVLPMAAQFHWDAAEVGIIQSALFWGYAATTVLGGFLATRFGGKRVLLAAVLLWSAMTVVAPFAASISTECFIASRVLVGIGEGLAPAAGINIVANWVPEAERSRAIATLGSGKNSGSILGLLIAPVVITSVGWPAMFYSFGILGLVWAAVWAVFGKDYVADDGLSAAASESSAAGGREEATTEEEAPIPWKQILSSAPLWGVIVAHFCHDWGMYALLTWTPTYLNQSLGFDLQGSSEITVIPSVLAIATALLAGTVADRLRDEGWELTAVRKTMQSLAFAVPALCLGLVGALGSLPEAESPSRIVPIVLLTLGIAGGSFSLAGLYSSHADLSTKYSGIVNGVSTTFGALAGVCSNAYAGQVLARGDSWAQ